MKNEAWGLKIHKESNKMRLGALRAIFRKQVGCDIATSLYSGMMLLVFVRHLVALGCHLCAHCILKVVPTVLAFLEISVKLERKVQAGVENR